MLSSQIPSKKSYEEPLTCKAPLPQAGCWRVHAPDCPARVAYPACAGNINPARRASPSLLAPAQRPPSNPQKSGADRGDPRVWWIRRGVGSGSSRAPHRPKKGADHRQESRSPAPALLLVRAVQTWGPPTAQWICQVKQAFSIDLTPAYWTGCYELIHYLNRTPTHLFRIVPLGRDSLRCYPGSREDMRLMQMRVMLKHDLFWMTPMRARVYALRLIGDLRNLFSRKRLGVWFGGGPPMRSSDSDLHRTWSDP
jgi:hypothetical protein